MSAATVQISIADATHDDPAKVCCSGDQRRKCSVLGRAVPRRGPRRVEGPGEEARRKASRQDFDDLRRIAGEGSEVEHTSGLVSAPGRCSFRVAAALVEVAGVVWPGKPLSRPFGSSA
jgi:hypothetical protein